MIFTRFPAITTIALLSSWLSVLAAPAQGQATSTSGYFLRGDVLFASPSEEGMDDGVGFLFRMGREWKRGDAAIEAGRLQFDQSFTVDLGEAGVFDADTEVDLTPVTLCGRYGFNLGKSERLQLLVGGLVGTANSSINVRVSQGGTPIDSVSADEWVVTYGLEAGVVVRFTSRFHLTGGFRYQEVGDATYSVGGTDATMDDFNVRILYVGCGVSL